MAIMFGNGTVKTAVNASNYLMKTVQVNATQAAAYVSTSSYEENGRIYEMINKKFYDANGSAMSSVTSASFSEGQKYFMSFDWEVASAGVIEISANSFPGTYYVVGDTYARSAESGEDEFFQFIIPKAKMQAENTITLEAEGDPSVFNMSLTVLRPDSGPMMMLVKYNVDSDPATEAAGVIYHNHVLDPETT